MNSHKPPSSTISRIDNPIGENDDGIAAPELRRIFLRNHDLTVDGM
jgi:hypothetical protein